MRRTLVRRFVAKSRGMGSRGVRRRQHAPLAAAPPPYAYPAPYGYYGGPVIVGPVFGFGYYRRW